MKTCSPTNFPSPCSYSYWEHLLSETIVSQAQPACICLIAAILKYNKVQNMFEVNYRSTRHCSDVFIVNFEYI